MAVPVRDFIIPEQSFPGLYQGAETIERRRLREDQLKAQREGKRAATVGQLGNLLDSKDYLTGTVYDPEITKRLNDALYQGAELASKGADMPSIMMALSPKIRELGDYSVKAKLINEQKQQALPLLKNQKGIDPNKFLKEFDEVAFFETDPNTGQRKMKDISKIDPNSMYADEVLRTRDVFTPEGFDEYMSKSGKDKRIQDTFLYTPKRGLRRAKVETVAPTFFQPDVDEKGVIKEFVPQYEIATDDESKVLHGFKGDAGEEVKAPVRMVTDDVFNSLPPNAKAYILQEVRRYSKEFGQPINSQQSYNLAKAITYDELKRSGKGYSTINETVVEKPNQISLSVSSGSGSGTSGLSVNDVFTRVEDAMSRPDNAISIEGKRIGTRMNSLDAEAQTAIFNSFGGRKDDMNETNTFLVEKDGNVKLYRTNDEGQPEVKPAYEVGTLKRTGTNLKVQPSVKEKREVIKYGDTKKTATRPNAQSGSGTYNIKGKDYSEKDLLDMGYTLDQIKPYKK